MLKVYDTNGNIIKQIPAIDHAGLEGLSDDDHTNYHTDTRGDARYLYKENVGAFTPDGNYEPATKKYVDDSVAGAGGGDMLKTVYDTDDDDRVDVAEGIDDGTNTATAADIADAVTKKHTQNTDTDLDLTFEATFVKKADTVNVLSDITSAGANIEDAVTKKHTQNTDTHLGTVDQDISFNTHKLTGVVDPTANQEAATKKYVDDNAGGVTDHGALTGLTDDDHTQYVLHTDVDDTPVNGETDQPISSNWAYDHGHDTVNIHTLLQDADGDTKIQVEEGADEDKIRMDVAGVEAFLLSDVGILTLAKQSRAMVTKSAVQGIPAGGNVKVLFDTESYDNQNEFDNSVKTGAADATEANKLHDADGGFASGDVGKTVWNTTDNTYTTVSAFVDSGELTLTDDIMVNGEGYKLYFSRFTAKEAGRYLVIEHVLYEMITTDKRLNSIISKNGSVASQNIATNALADWSACISAHVLDLAANDYVEGYTRQDDTVTRDLHSAAQFVYMVVQKID